MGSGNTAPQPKLDLFRCRLKVVISAEQNQVVPQAQLNQYGIDRSDLNAVSSTSVANPGGVNVVLAIRLVTRRRSAAQDARHAWDAAHSWFVMPNVRVKQHGEARCKP
jgi:hypothetical protein